MLKNIFFRIYSILYSIYLKYFFKNINMKGYILSNGFFDIEIDKNAKLIIKGTIVIRSGVLIAIRNNAKLTVGGGCFFNRNVSVVCREEIYIDKMSIFGENVKIYDNDHKIIKGRVAHSDFTTKKIYIGNNCWVGNDVNILKGSCIPEDTVIGAMSLVKSKLEKKGVYIGIPVRRIGK